MDRIIIYPGAIPLDTDLLSAQRNAMIGLGALAQATLGTSVVADGLACLPTSPASMSVVVGPGSVTQFGSVDQYAYGSLAASASQITRMGSLLDPVTLTLAAPTVPGQAITYCIQAAFLEVDDLPVVLPYYNAANPAVPFSGPTNGGSAQNTRRRQTVQIELKQGAPGAAGTQSAPAVDAGWVGLYEIVVQYGQTSIAATAISAFPGAPFLQWKLPQLSPGTHNLAVFTTANQGRWVVPAGISAVKLRVWGGGGAGGAGFGGAGGGGAGGGYAEGFFAVTPGASYLITVGSGGAGSGGAGGASSFGTFAAAGGGQAGANGSSGLAGAGATNAGVGSCVGLAASGQAGGSGFPVSGGWVGGSGGGCFGAPGGAAVVALGGAAADGHAGVLPGAGGSGGVGAGLGGQGGTGLVLVEW